MGCSPLEAKAPVIVDEHIVKTELIEVPLPGTKTTATTNDGELVVESKHLCDVREWNTVQRDVETRYETRPVWVDVLLAAGGVGAAATGLALLVDSSNVTPARSNDDGFARNGGEIALGTTLVVGGAVLASLAVIDFQRMRQITRTKDVDHMAGRKTAANVMCRGGFIEGANVELRLGRVSYGAGLTDANGRLFTKLDSVLDRDVRLPLGNASAKLVIAGQVEGEVDLRALAAQRETERWRSVNLQQCAEAFTLDGCSSVESYLREYPEGTHADDARRALERAAPTLLKLRDQFAWHRIQPSMATCSRDSSEPVAIDVACGVVSGYVRELPKGEHVREAEAAIASGKARAASLRATASKNEKEKCTSTCRTHCASASVSHFDDCFKGCIDGRCAKSL